MAVMVFSVGRLGAFSYSQTDYRLTSQKNPEQINLTQTKQKTQLDALDLTFQFLLVSEI